MEQNIYEIWHSDVLNKYRLELIEKKRNGLCKKCDYNDYPNVKNPMDNQNYMISKMKTFFEKLIK